MNGSTPARSDFTAFFERDAGASSPPRARPRHRTARASQVTRVASAVAWLILCACQRKDAEPSTRRRTQ
jgi:hypothetical protein